MKPLSLPKLPSFAWLFLFWILSIISDRLWLSLDQYPPAWDQSNHLNLSLKYLDALQNPQFLSGEWWHNFWMISTKYPPLTYLLTTPIQQVLGTGADQALWVNSVCNGILILSLYYLGKILFNAQVGLWSAGLFLLFPRLYSTRLHYLLDTPMMALTIAGFCALTYWKLAKNRQHQWLWTGLFGVSLGLILLTKQSGLFFLFIPLLWLGISQLWQRKWERLLQLIVSLLISGILWFPWYRTNWIYLFSTAQNSVVIPATAEGDPSLNTLAAWTYYWQDLPLAITWILLLIPLVGFALHFLKQFPVNKEKIESQKIKQSKVWLGLYLIAGYLICSANFNKDSRYIMPLLPILGMVLSYGLLLWRGRWQWVRWATVSLAILVMIGKLYAIPVLSPVANLLSPDVSYYPQINYPNPNPKMIQSVIKNAPYQRINLGVIPNVEQINHNTMNYYGALQDFQVYGRELGSNDEKVSQDSRSMDWFVTKEGGDKGFTKEAQFTFAETLSSDDDFQILETATLPDQSIIKLYRRKTPTVQVFPSNFTQNKVKLEKVIVPQSFPASQPVPITYQWIGSGEHLENGLVLLNWKLQDSPDNQSFWLHDHGLGMGMLKMDKNQNQIFQVIENTAMLPDQNLPSGNYTLEAIYLNRETRETYPIETPKITITLDPNSSSTPAPPLDFVTQLRQLSKYLPQGVKELDPIFAQVDRINQYDPLQDYLKQAEIALTYRLQNNPQLREIPWLYNLALSYVLQEDPQGAMKTLETLVQRDKMNPYAHAYLAFIHLYQWHPKAAEKVLQPALTLAPEVEEIKGLEGIATAMQGNLFKAWRILKPIL